MRRSWMLACAALLLAGGTLSASAALAAQETPTFYSGSDVTYETVANPKG